MAKISVLGVDLGKNVCSVVGLDASGAVVMRRRMRRDTLIGLAEKLPACVVGMEACCDSHHVGRVFASHGHDVRLMSPEYVRPYVKAQKNDDRDAEGIAEATTRPTMRFVELKSQDQLDMQTLHRSRDRLVGERTALINQLRAILLERGLVAPQGKWKLKQFLNVLMDKQGGASLSPRVILLVQGRGDPGAVRRDRSRFAQRVRGRRNFGTVRAQRNVALDETRLSPDCRCERTPRRPRVRVRAHEPGVRPRLELMTS